MVDGPRRIQPHELQNFWELDGFVESWNDLGLDDSDLSALQFVLMCQPKAGDVMQGTHGLRKLRFSPESWNTGKSHGVRVCYVHFEKYGMTLLCCAFRKGELDNISAAGKKTINREIDRIEARLVEKYGF